MIIFTVHFVLFGLAIIHFHAIIISYITKLLINFLILLFTGTSQIPSLTLNDLKSHTVLEKNQQLIYLFNCLLTYLFPMHPFLPLENIRCSDVFRGQKREHWEQIGYIIYFIYFIILFILSSHTSNLTNTWFVKQVAF